MIILEAEQEKFAYSYIEKHLGEQAPKGLKALSDYIESLDKAFYKRMMGAYRAAKKRQNDMQNGNYAVNVSLTNSAHQRLKCFANSHNVTLSMFIEHYMNNGMITSELNLQNENNQLRYLVDNYKTELEKLEKEVNRVKELNKTISRQNVKLNKENEQLKADLRNEKAAGATILRRTKKAILEHGITL